MQKKRKWVKRGELMKIGKGRGRVELRGGSKRGKREKRDKRGEEKD